MQEQDFSLFYLTFEKIGDQDYIGFVSPSELHYNGLVGFRCGDYDTLRQKHDNLSNLKNQYKQSLLNLEFQRQQMEQQYQARFEQLKGI